MRRISAPLILAAVAAAGLTGCVPMPPGAPFGIGHDGSYDPVDDSSYEEVDRVAEEEWQAENRAWELDFTESVAEELRAAGSQLPPAEGESLEAFRHVVVGVGLEWCDRLYVDESRIGDVEEHAEQADRYRWSIEEYRIVVEAAEVALCGY